MRVAHVHRIRGIGGSERHLLTLLPALAELGVEPVLVGLDDPAWDPADFYGALTVPAIRIPSPRDLDPLLLARLRALAPRRRRAHASRARRRLRRGRCEAARRARSSRRSTTTTRSGSARSATSSAGSHGSRDRIVTITESLRRFTVDKVGIPATKVETIHYGLDGLPEAWGENPPDDVPAGARVLLAVSRLTEQKGIDVAVRALPSLPDDTVLVVLGEGPERPALEALARQLGVERRVFLPGRVPDVAAWLRRATLLVHPARWEGFGLGVLEAMLAGLPVVASNVSSLPELVVDGETGILVRPDDSPALALGVARALEEPERLGAAGRERARSEFSVARMSGRTAELYRSL